MGFPYPPTIARAIAELLVEIITRGVRDTFGLFLNDLSQLVLDVVDSFPNVFKMSDLVYTFATGWLGRALTFPWRGVESLAISAIELGGYKSRVVTFPDAVRLVGHSLSNVVTTLTGTSETPLLQALVQALARLLWQRYKQISFIRKIITVKSEVELVELIWAEKIAKRGLLYRALLIFTAFFAVVVWTGALAMLLGIALGVLDGSVEKWLLPQDSKREWRKKGGVHRVNKRKGRDFAPA